MGRYGEEGGIDETTTLNAAFLSPAT